MLNATRFEENADPDGRAALSVTAMMTDTPASAGSRRAWYIVAVLATLYAISFVDRFILSILAQALRESLAIDDGRLSILMGFGFTLVYVVAGLPIAHLVDRGRRKPLLVAGVSLWGMATMASGLANDFSTLLLFRTGVAIGEAVLTPAAISLIADIFPPHRRGAAVSLYSSVGSFMISGSVLVGGLTLAQATLLAPILGWAPWRLTFFMVGLPAIALALLVQFSIREPERTHRSSATAPGVGFSQYLRALHRHRRFFLPFLLSAGLSGLMQGSLVAWTPTVLVRSYGMPAAEAGYIFGLVGMPTIVIGNLIWPVVAGRLGRKDRGRGLLTALCAATCIAAPFFTLMTRMPSLALFCFLFCFTFIGFSAWGVIPALTIQHFGSTSVHARLMATYLLVLNLVGYAGGPLAIVLLGRIWGDVPGALAHAFSLLGAVAGSVTLIFCLLARHAAQSLAGPLQWEE